MPLPLPRRSKHDRISRVEIAKSIEVDQRDYSDLEFEKEERTLEQLGQILDQIRTFNLPCSHTFRNILKDAIGPYRKLLKKKTDLSMKQKEISQFYEKIVPETCNENRNNHTLAIFSYSIFLRVVIGHMICYKLNWSKIKL